MSPVVYTNELPFLANKKTSLQLQLNKLNKWCIYASIHNT